MKYIIITDPYLFKLIPHPPLGMALYPFILVRKPLKDHPILLNHEKIHLYQEIEMGILFFYIFYLLHYFYNLLRFRNHHKAYKNICFEKEAFANDQNMRYLAERKPYAFLRYI